MTLVQVVRQLTEKKIIVQEACAILCPYCRGEGEQERTPKFSYESFFDQEKGDLSLRMWVHRDKAGYWDSTRRCRASSILHEFCAEQEQTDKW